MENKRETQAIELLNDVNGEPIKLGDLVYLVPKEDRPVSGLPQNVLTVVALGSSTVWVRFKFRTAFEVAPDQLTHDSWNRINADLEAAVSIIERADCTWHEAAEQMRNFVERTQALTAQNWEC